MNRFACMTLIFSFALCQIQAQLPKTEVFLAEFKNIGTKPDLISLKFLSGFNPNGYNNQARLINQNEIFLTCAMDTNRQTDIYHLDLISSEFRKFTNTKLVSEFSPVLFADKSRLSTIRIEKDGIDQSLWSYPINRSDLGYRLFSQLNNVGYYAWLDIESVAMFLVGNPHQLVIGNTKSNKIKVIAENIGRCLKTDPNGNLLYVHKLRPDTWMLKSYNLQENAHNNVCVMPLNKEDFDVLPDGQIIVSDGSLMKIIQPTSDTNWKIFADFSRFGIQNIQRPSVSGNHIVFINVK